MLDEEFQVVAFGVAHEKALIVSAVVILGTGQNALLAQVGLPFLQGGEAAEAEAEVPRDSRKVGFFDEFKLVFEIFV